MSPTLHICRRAVQADPRWPLIASALIDLCAARRHAVRIVDANCGSGTVLIGALAFARSLGFSAIEGRGIDHSPAMIARARATAMHLDDRAIGLTFERRDAVAALAEEVDFPADIIIWRAATGVYEPQMADLLHKAGKRIVHDTAFGSEGLRAA